MGDKLGEAATGLAGVAGQLNDLSSQISSGDIDLTEQRAELSTLLSSAANTLTALSSALAAASDALGGEVATEEPASE